MASKTLLTPEQYLAMSFDREPEFVHGELVEKSLPNNDHSRTQQRLSVLLDRAGHCRPELRMKLAEDVYRIPDFALFENDPGNVPTSPPILAVEIASPDDRVRDLELKLDEFRKWGVAHIWFVNPELQKLYTYDRGLMNVAQFELPQFGITITLDQLFS
jgi:Uma2 family endonuclease